MDETVSVAEFERMMASGAAFALLDVRRQVDFDADDEVIPGARRADPERLEAWSPTLDPSEAVVIYCVKGGSVSKSVRGSLIERGLNVRYIEGGIAAWRAHDSIAKDST